MGGVREWTQQKDPVNYPMESEGCYDYVSQIPDAGNPDKRWSGAFAQVGSTVYCMGGYSLNPTPPPPPSAEESIVSDRNQSYNIATETWVDGLAVLPQPAAFAAAAANTIGDVFVIGGIDNNGVVLDTVQGYRPGADAWAAQTAIPEGRFSFAAAAVGDTVYVCGGLTDPVTNIPANYSDAVYAYDTIANTWTQPLPALPQARRCHTMVSIGTKLYVLGGFYWDDVAAGGVDLRDVLEIETNPPAAAWTHVGDLPKDVAGHVAVVHQTSGKIYVMGGWSLDGVKYDVFEYDPATQTSKTLTINGRSAQFGWPNYWYFVGISGDLIAKIGGWGGASNAILGTPHNGMHHFNQVYVYDVSKPDP